MSDVVEGTVCNLKKPESLAYVNTLLIGIVFQRAALYCIDTFDFPNTIKENNSYVLR